MTQVQLWVVGLHVPLQQSVENTQKVPEVRQQSNRLRE
jgi:hypothetical protein